MLPPNNFYYSSIVLLIPTVQAIAVHGSATIDGEWEEIPPPPKRDGGVSAARSSGPRLSPSPATPELAPHPWDSLRVPATNAAAPLFLPPALSLIHPVLYLPASIFVLLTPARNPKIPQASSPSSPPSPPHSNKNAANQHSVKATRDPSPEDVRPRATQSASSSSPPSRAGGGRAQNTAPCCSRDRAATRLGTSARSSLVVIIVVGGSAWRWLLDAEAATEEAAAAVIMTCFVVGCGCMFCVFGWQCMRCVC